MAAVPARRPSYGVGFTNAGVDDHVAATMLFAFPRARGGAERLDCEAADFYFAFSMVASAGGAGGRSFQQRGEGPVKYKALVIDCEIAGSRAIGVVRHWVCSGHLSIIGPPG